MRCKNCKKNIENENLFRCPHCGKPIQKKKKRDVKELASVISFFAISFIFVVLNFFSLFFKCDYYNSAAIVIGIVVYLVILPFVFGNYKGMKRSVADIFGVVLSLPFLANWIVGFAKNSDYLASDVKSIVYYFSVLANILIIDIIMILKASGAIGNGKIIKWVCLALGVIEGIFSIVFYAGLNVVQPMAIAIIAFNALMPGFIAYHIISRDSKDIRS
ncbi:MAG: hypothetical protein MJ168_01675 [Clostridia bacterium]|nr:hypothetical protein [Clostridia bacterium]